VKTLENTGKGEKSMVKKVTGAAKGDLSGYTIELTAEEKDYAPFLASAAKTALYAAVEDVYVS
jgi:hypothetical protein